MRRTSGGDDDGYKVLYAVNEDEIEVVQALLILPAKPVAKEELLSDSRSEYTFEWGKRKIRSVLVPKLPAPAAPSQVKIGGEEKQPQKVVAIEGAKSPATPLSFSPSCSDSDKSKPESLQLKKNSKKRSREELEEEFDKQTKERELLKGKVEAMENLHQELKTENLALKARREEILWANTMNMNQIRMLFPLPQHCQQQLMADQNHGKLLPMFLASPPYSNSNSGGGFGTANEKDIRGNIPDLNVCAEESFGLVVASQPLDVHRGLQVDNDHRARDPAAAAAADARRRRMLKIRENRKVSRT